MASVEQENTMLQDLIVDNKNWVLINGIYDLGLENFASLLITIINFALTFNIKSDFTSQNWIEIASIGCGFLHFYTG